MEEFKEGSPNTSVNQIAGGFKKVNWVLHTVNLDVGGGKYEKATEYLLNEHDVTNLVYDPYNRSETHNKEVLKQADEAATTTTIFNVLNVIPEEKDRVKLIGLAKRKNTKTIYISVYERDGNGIGVETSKGWQNNKKLRDYLPEVQKVYPDAEVQKGLIVISL